MGGNSKSVIYEDTYFDLATFNVLRKRNTETTDNRIISFGVGATVGALQITDSGFLCRDYINSILIKQL